MWSKQVSFTGHGASWRGVEDVPDTWWKVVRVDLEGQRGDMQSTGKYKAFRKNIFFPNLTLSFFPIANIGTRRSLHLHKHQQPDANTIYKAAVLSVGASWKQKLYSQMGDPEGMLEIIQPNCLVSTDKKTEFPRGNVICPQLLSGRAGKRTLIPWLSVKRSFLEALILL